MVVVIIGPPISIFTQRFHAFNTPRLERDLDYNVSVILDVAGSCMAAALASGPIPFALLKFTKPNGVTVPPLFLASHRGPASVPPRYRLGTASIFSQSARSTQKSMNAL